MDGSALLDRGAIRETCWLCLLFLLVLILQRREDPLLLCFFFSGDERSHSSSASSSPATRGATPLLLLRQLWAICRAPLQPPAPRGPSIVHFPWSDVLTAHAAHRWYGLLWRRSRMATMGASSWNARASQRGRLVLTIFLWFIFLFAFNYFSLDMRFRVHVFVSDREEMHTFWMAGWLR